MSGEVEDDKQRRYNEIIQRIHANNRRNCVGQSEETINPQQFYRGNTGVPSRIEEPLNAQQLYRGNTTACVPPSATVTSYAPSESSSVFKVPTTTVQKHMNWTRIKGVVNSFINSYRDSDIEQFLQKLWVRCSLEILLLGQQNPHIKNGGEILDMMYQSLKDQYYGDRSCDSRSYAPTEISVDDRYGSMASLSTVFNDNRDLMTSHFINPDGPSYPYLGMARNPLHPQNRAGQPNPYIPLVRNTTLQPQHQAGQNSYIPMDRSTALQSQNQAGQPNSYIPIDRNTTLQSQNQAGQPNSYIPIDRNTTLQSQNQAGEPNPYVREDRNTILQAQNQAGQSNPYMREDRNTTMQSQNQGAGRGGRKVQPLKPPNRVLKGHKEITALINENQQRLDVSKNDTVSCGKGLSRFGRQIKSPNQFWKSIEKKMNEPSVINFSKSKKTNQTTSPPEDLNESMALRNNKLIIKGTPYVKKNVKTNLSPLEEKKTKPKAKTTQQPKNKPGRKRKEDKENTSTEIKPPKKVSSKVVKKPPVKRKSASNNLTISKRQKVEESVLSDCSLDSDSDELFEPLFSKKRAQPMNQVLSPSNGLHSVKKALARSNSKETPPAKLISQLIDPDVMPTSSAKGMPETTLPQVVNRVTKVVQRKEPKKVIKKTATTKSSNADDAKLEKIINDVITKSTYTTETPGGKTTLTVFRTTEAADNSEESGMSESDMDDDLL